MTPEILSLSVILALAAHLEAHTQAGWGSGSQEVNMTHLPRVSYILGDS